MDISDPQLMSAAKRVADAINVRMTFTSWADLAHQWMAFRLSDGGSDGVVYEHRIDAVRHQLHETQCMYICFKDLVGGAKAHEIAHVILFHRAAYEGGAVLPDPEQPFGGAALIMRVTDVDYLRRWSG